MPIPSQKVPGTIIALLAVATAARHHAAAGQGLAGG